MHIFTMPVTKNLVLFFKAGSQELERRDYSRAY